MSFTTWGATKLPIRVEVAEALDEVKKANAEIGGLLWESFIQGRGSAKLSGVTHLGGFAADFSFRVGHWNAETALHVAHALLPHFAVAFRHHGELGPDSPPHLHIAFKGQSNSFAIEAHQAAIGPDAIKEAIAKCFPDSG